MGWPWRISQLTSPFRDHSRGCSVEGENDHFQPPCRLAITADRGAGDDMASEQKGAFGPFGLSIISSQPDVSACLWSSKLKCAHCGGLRFTRIHLGAGRDSVMAPIYDSSVIRASSEARAILPSNATGHLSFSRGWKDPPTTHRPRQPSQARVA